MRLYKIHDADIIKAMESPDLEEKEGERLVVLKMLPKKFGGLPPKVVYKEIEKGSLVITV